MIVINITLVIVVVFLGAVVWTRGTLINTYWTENQTLWKEIRSCRDVFHHASLERTRADKLISKIMLQSDSPQVSKLAQEISEILRGEGRVNNGDK